MRGREKKMDREDKVTIVTAKHSLNEAMFEIIITIMFDIRINTENIL